MRMPHEVAVARVARGAQACQRERINVSLRETFEVAFGEYAHETTQEARHEGAGASHRLRSARCGAEQYRGQHWRRGAPAPQIPGPDRGRARGGRQPFHGYAVKDRE